MSHLTIVGGTVFQGAELRSIEDSSIVIADGSIAEIGERRTADARPSGDLFDASGMFLVPGFIDAHVHIGFFDPALVVGRGVTTVRDLGWPEPDIFSLARASREPGFVGPEILAAGPLLTTPGGYPTRAAWAPKGTGLVIEDRVEARREVERLAQEGAAVIKVALDGRVGPTLPLVLVRAITDAAHEIGLRVTAHVAVLSELEKAIDAGIDELAHMLMSEERIPPELIERMVAADMTIVPTLSCRFGSDRAQAVDNLARFRDAGGKIVYGTDLGNEGPSPGIDHLEVTGMIEAGCSLADIIRSATVDSARWLGFHDRGTLEPGRRADIVAFGRWPKVAADLQDVSAVWRAGRRVV
jgi:imidazolonepropionase-like amidohydrolase